MNERQRMQYLEALGVEMFTPRWVLPGAQLSRQCQLPVAEADTALVQAGKPVSQGGASRRAGHVGGAQERPRPATGSLVDSLLDTGSPQPPAVAVASERAAAFIATAGEKKQKAAFSLAFWRIHSQVMVVDSRQPSKALPTETLLRNIVAGLGLRKPLPRAEIQNWPLAGGGDQGWDAAREMIQAFLESRLLSHPVRYLVLMGADAVKVILDNPDTAIGRRVNVDTFACDALTAPSLTDLLLEPRQKAVLWRLFSPLKCLPDE